MDEQLTRQCILGIKSEKREFILTASPKSKHLFFFCIPTHLSPLDSPLPLEDLNLMMLSFFNFPEDSLKLIWQHKI